MKQFTRGRSYNSNSRSGHFSPRRGYRSKPKAIDSRLFIKKAADTVEVPYEPVHDFTDFPLHKTVLKNIVSRGFHKPTAVQDQAIMPILEGKDLVGIADTGTGKTAAFLLPLITKVGNDRTQKVLIVTPTRELAAQIRDEFLLFSHGMGLQSTLVIGGASLNIQARQLSRQPQFVIGTPGRLMDMEQRRSIHFGEYQNVVLDEVDRMLDMGFIRDVQFIISRLPTPRTSLFFSATLPASTKTVMKTFLHDYVSVSVKTSATSQNVDQDTVRIQGRDKLDILHNLLIQEDFKKVLIFGRTKWGINKLETNLINRGFKAIAIHGNKSQAQRMRALKSLKNGEVQILLATDVVARGIDIDNVTHVINYDAPETYEDYIHRIGRTGRAGKKGIALTFVD